MATQPRNLGIRLDEQLTERLEAFEKRTGVGAATLGRGALVAALDYFELHQRISFPLVVIEAHTHKFPAPPSKAETSMNEGTTAHQAQQTQPPQSYEEVLKPGKRGRVRLPVNVPKEIEDHRRQTGTADHK